MTSIMLTATDQDCISLSLYLHIRALSLASESGMLVYAAAKVVAMVDTSADMLRGELLADLSEKMRPVCSSVL